MEIQHIKENLTITTVLAHYGLKADKNKRIVCPFHDDSTPSMQVYNKTNTVYCFSSNCKLHGKAIDTIDFIMHKENTTKHEALIKAGSMVNTTSVTIVPESENKTTTSGNLPELFKQLQQNLSKSSSAKAYLQSRNLDSTKIEVGYNVTTIGNLKNCIVFALRNKNNEVVSLYGRSIYNNTNQRHYYQANRTGLYPHYPNENTKKIILTESIIDAATLLQLPEIASNYSVLACYGTNGLTEEHTKAIKQLNQLQEIIFAFDNDEAGNKAVEKYSNELKELLPNVILSGITLPCNDVNETAQAHNDSSIFTHLINERLALSAVEGAFLFSNEIKESLTHPIIPTLPTAQKLNTKDLEQIHYHSDELLITLLGGISLQNLDRLRVTIYLRRNPHINAQQSIRQNVDLYQDDTVEKFIRKAAEKLNHSTSLITATIAEMTEAIEAWRLKQIENKKANKPVKKELTMAERTTAISHLKRDDLMQWTMNTLMQTGIIGEAENALILHIAMTSRLYEDPVSVICLSQSGTGKSYLLERVVKCFPIEDIIENTQFTDNSFYYWKEGLKGKAIIIEDMEGAQNVEYEIRELISKKYITKTTVHKDAKGNMQTVQHRVEGPATFLGCTTKEKIYEDNANRCILIYLDASKEQDKNIMDYQKQVRAGTIDKMTEQKNREQLQNMQRLLQPKNIINPYATFIDLPESVLKPRRSIGILLSFIEAITLYHQYHPSTQAAQTSSPLGRVGEGLVTHPTHIEWGFKLLKESLFRKSDELSATLRNFLEDLKSLLQKEKKKSFYPQETRLLLNKDPRTIRRYLAELNLYGYIKITGGNKYRKGFEYELTELCKGDNLKSLIDKHIEQVMQKIWKAYEQRK